MRHGDVIEIVPSLTSPGAGYEITRGEAGIGYVCSCPRSAFRRKGSADECSHLKIFRAAEVLIEKCLKAGHPGHLDSTHPLICRRCLVALMAASARKVRTNYQPKKARRAK